MEGQRPYKLTYHLSQNENIEAALNLLKQNLTIEENYPQTIIELGTYQGGFSFLLKDTFTQAEVHTFDLMESCDMKQLAIDADIKTYHTDIFTEDTVNLIKSLIQSPGQTVLFVDNGDKPREFNLFSTFLKSGDIILAHDYAPNEAYFNNVMRNKIWNWWEINDSNIEDSCKIHELSDYMREEFLLAAWICKRKS